jgi:peroxiredoxin Q/BCP
MLEADQSAPDFTLPDQQGANITLSRLRGRPVVLYFYPKDETPGCTREACAFRDDHPEFDQAGALILGISPDDVATHRRFTEKHALRFTLLADAEHRVCTLYGVWKEKNLYGKKSMGVERTTFVIDRDGVVRRIFPRVKVDGHAREVLEAVRALGNRAGTPSA